MPLTLKDIARIVGVAESTVSRAINNKPGVGAATRKKIMKIVEEYDFQPNQLARGLAKNETHLLALLLSELNNPGNLDIVRKVEEITNQAGYQVLFCNTAGNLDKEKAYLNLVKRQQVDGAIIIGGELADTNILNLALNKQNKLVLVNRMAEELLIPTVMIDSSRGAYLATAHLIEQGFERIAIIMGHRTDFLEGEKLAGYIKALKEYKLEGREEMIIETDGSREDGYNSFLKLMENRDFPRAFFTTTDLLAVGVSEAIKTGGYLIPNDFALVSYGESILTSIIDPPLTVVAEPLEELGLLAGKYLLALIRGEELPEMIKVLEPDLRVRDSSSR